MTTDLNKQIVRHWLEDVWGRGDADLQDELLARDIVDHNPMPGLAGGVEGQKQLVRMMHAAFTFHFCRPDLLLADGDYVVSRNTSEMTHTGEFMGLTPTGKRVTVTGIDISLLQDGGIVELWHQEDIAGLMQQLQGSAPA